MVTVTILKSDQLLHYDNELTICSGAVVAFYVYRIRLNEEETKGSNIEPGKEI